MEARSARVSIEWVEWLRCACGMPGVPGTGLISGEGAGCECGLRTCEGSEEWARGVCAKGEPDEAVAFLRREEGTGTAGPDWALSRYL